MTQDEIIEMVREAGYPDVYTEWAKFDWSSIKGLIVPMTLEQLKHCAKLIAEKAAVKEREECAKICDSFQARDVGMQPAECAGAIRARGTT